MMEEEQQNLFEESAPVQKKRGRPKKSEQNQPTETAAKKRGRPKKSESGQLISDAPEVPQSDEAQAVSVPESAGAKSLDETLEGEVKRHRARGGRSAKIPRTDGPQWRDAPVAAPQETERQDGGESDDEAEIFVHKDKSDDFEYATHSEETGEENDGDIPTYFSTTDEDLDPDAYRAADGEIESADAEVAESDDRRIAEAREYENAVDEEPFERQDDSRNRWQKRNNNRFERNNRQGRQNGDNRQQFQNNRQQNQNNRFQKNRSQQQGNNRQQFQNNQQNRQQNQQQNGRQQKQQQQQQKQKKPRWMQNQNAEEQFINPADLPEWHALKSQKALEEYLARVYLGKSPETESFENATPISIGELENSRNAQAAESAGGAAYETAANEAVADTETRTDGETALDSTEQLSESESAQKAENETAEYVAPQKSLSDMNYWELMVNANDSAAKKYGLEKGLIEKSTEQTESETAKEPQAEGKSGEPAPYDEPTSMKIGGFGEIESIGGFDEVRALGLRELREKYDVMQIPYRAGCPKTELVADYFKYARENKKLVALRGVLDVFEDGFGGALAFADDNYRLGVNSVYVPQMFIDRFGLKRGHTVGVLAMPPRENGRETCPVAVCITSVMGGSPESAKNTTPFTDLVPYYPTRRIIMEDGGMSASDNLSMRAVDLLTPIGFGQRALIVAPPRTGKTVLMQAMAKSIRRNAPDARLIILLVDERPEEVTDFRRSVDAEVIASTFDEEASNHVHAAEMVISRARRMVECGEDVVILLDSITRLARAYNALMPNGGRTMSGGVEANALQKPKKFFGSARNIEGGGSLTIIGTALVETGSKMDEVIFEEFKGTGNLELHLDRALSDKRIFPAINIEKSGTRKEELLYHPDEMSKIYALRRAMKGVPATDAMEMLVQRLKKVRTNVEFLLGLNR